MTLEYIPMAQRPKFQTVFQAPHYNAALVKLRLVRALGTVPPKFRVIESDEHDNKLREIAGTPDALGIPEAVAKQATRDWPGATLWPL